MKINSKPFLYSYTIDIDVGDLVVWKEWEKQDDTTFISADQRGAVVGFIQKSNWTHSWQEGERTTVYAIVLPYGETKTREIPVHLIKKRTN